jgi:import inner membrane translocase subunit TIM23
MLGTFGGGLYGLREGVRHSPSSRFRVKLNSILNHCGRYGSRWGNSLGVVAILYSIYEGAADQVSRDGKGCCEKSDVSVVPWFGGLHPICVLNPPVYLCSLTLTPIQALFNERPLFSGFMTGATFYASAGPRAALFSWVTGYGSGRGHLHWIHRVGHSIW